MRRSLPPLAVLLFGLGCTHGTDEPVAPRPDDIYAELLENGALQYRGVFPPEVLGSGGRIDYRWDPATENGPRCIGTDDPATQVFQVITRERNSDDLIIYLQGGGLCAASTEGACEREGIPFLPSGVLSGAIEQPFRDFDLAYVPYCDGSLFLGDVTQVLDGEEYVQRGRQNITAALDAIAQRFPNPPRIALIGVSAGGFATLFAAPMVRIYFPEAEVMVVNDSGIGITRGEREPEFVDELLDSLGASQFIPESCTQCFVGGHAIQFADWVLQHDPAIRMAVLSHTRDNVIASTFLGVPLDWFETELRRETAALSERYGDRYGRYLIPGEGHTALVAGTITGVGDTSMIFPWLQQFVDHDPAWQDMEQMNP
ncbi:MAG: pectin acetylesterase-family hydrolase [Polyangiales bacterium]